MPRSALVTGATGFIGSHLVRRLSDEGWTVSALLRPGSELGRLSGTEETVKVVRGDVTDCRAVTSAVEAARPDAVFHLAMAPAHPGDSAPARLEMIRHSVVGTAAVAEACIGAQPVRLVHAGSALEYAPGDSPHTEDDPIGPVSFRGMAKACATTVVATYSNELGLDATVARIFSTYGPLEPKHRFIPTLVSAALDGTDIRLTRPGIRHDFVYVSDVADALIAIAEKGQPGEIFNVASGVEWSNEEVVEIAEKVTGASIRIGPGEYPAKDADAPSRVADVSKTRRMLGWTAKRSLADGLGATYEWLRNAR